MLNLAKAEPEFVALHAIADRLEPELRRAFLAALDTLQKQLPLNVLTDLLEAQNFTALGELVAQLKLPDTVVDALRAVMIAAAIEAGTFTGARIGLSFTLDNPAVIRWAERHVGQQIVGLEATTRDAVVQRVRDIVSRSIVEGIPPRQQARSIRDVVGLTEHQAKSVALYREGLIETETPRRQIDRLVAARRKRMIAQRAEAIARTETIRAAERGKLQAWRDAVDEGLLDPTVTRRVWLATDDDRTCPICRELDGKTIGFDSPDGFPIAAAAATAAERTGQPSQVNRVFTNMEGNTDPEINQTPPAHVMCRCDEVLEFVE